MKWNKIQRKDNKVFSGTQTHLYIYTGNEKLHKLTSQAKYELRVNIDDFKGNTAFAKYSIFSVGDASSKYKLNAGGYTGTAGEFLHYDSILYEKLSFYIP